MTTNPATPTYPIDQVIAAFANGDVPTLLGHVADDVDLRIDHYRDGADTRWQVASDKQGLIAMLQRLAVEVFPGARRSCTPTASRWATTGCSRSSTSASFMRYNSGRWKA